MFSVEDIIIFCWYFFISCFNKIKAASAVSWKYHTVSSSMILSGNSKKKNSCFWDCLFCSLVWKVKRLLCTKNMPILAGFDFRIWNAVMNFFCPWFILRDLMLGVEGRKFLFSFSYSFHINGVQIFNQNPLFFII